MASESRYDSYRIMRIENLHSWNVSPREAILIQEQLANKIKTQALIKTPQIIAGADIAFDKVSNKAFAGIVILQYPSLEVVKEYTLEDEVLFPYIPGLLSFREAPILLRLFKKVTPAPDLLLIDGQGIAHPRRLGLASHLGLYLNCPTIGCAKSRLIGSYQEPGVKKGSSSPLLDKQTETIGAVLRTKDGCKPIFVSIGHQIDLDNALYWTLKCTAGYRIPEPTRLAHNLVEKFKTPQIKL